MNRYERKERLGHGAAREVARELGCGESTVSEVINDKAGNTELTHRIKVRLARKAKVRVAQLFPRIEGEVTQEPFDDSTAPCDMQGAA